MDADFACNEEGIITVTARAYALTFYCLYQSQHCVACCPCTGIARLLASVMISKSCERILVFVVFTCNAVLGVQDKD
jgi:hypothetical protein